MNNSYRKKNKLTNRQNCWKYCCYCHRWSCSNCWLLNSMQSKWVMWLTTMVRQLQSVNRHSVELDCRQNVAMFWKVTESNFVSGDSEEEEITVSYLKVGDAEPALPEHDFDIDWWFIICAADDCGRSKSESVRGLCGGTLELRCSSSLSPIMSGDDSRLCSVLFVMFGVFSPLSRFRCSSLRRSAFRHFARRFWNQTYPTRSTQRERKQIV